MQIIGKVPKSIIKKAESVNRKYKAEVIREVSKEYECAGEAGWLYWAYSSWVNVDEEGGTVTAETAAEMIDKLSSDWMTDEQWADV